MAEALLCLVSSVSRVSSRVSSGSAGRSGRNARAGGGEVGHDFAMWKGCSESVSADVVNVKFAGASITTIVLCVAAYPLDMFFRLARRLSQFYLLHYFSIVSSQSDLSLIHFPCKPAFGC